MEISRKTQGLSGGSTSTRKRSRYAPQAGEKTSGGANPSIEAIFVHKDLSNLGTHSSDESDSSGTSLISVEEGKEDARQHPGHKLRKLPTVTPLTQAVEIACKGAYCNREPLEQELLLFEEVVKRVGPDVPSSIWTRALRSTCHMYGSYTEWYGRDSSAEVGPTPYRVIHTLLTNGADGNVQDGHGWTPSHRLAYVSGLYKTLADSIYELAKHGANLDKKDKKGRTPLHLACLRNNKVSAGALFELGARPSITNNSYVTPAHYACFIRTSVGVLELFGAIDARDFPDTAQYRKIFGQDIRGMTPLHFACYAEPFPKSRSIEIIIKCQTDNDNLWAIDREGRNALHHACRSSKASDEMLELLCAAGPQFADLLVQDRDGNTPLLLAVASNSTTKLAIVLSALWKASDIPHDLLIPREQRPFKRDPRHQNLSASLAAALQSEDSASSDDGVHESPRPGGFEPQSKDIYRARGRVLRKRNRRGHTALHYACKHGNEEMVKLLLIPDRANIFPLFKREKPRSKGVLELARASGNAVTISLIEEAMRKDTKPSVE